MPTKRSCLPRADLDEKETGVVIRGMNSVVRERVAIQHDGFAMRRVCDFGEEGLSN